jgi:prepilin-type N-terminal cleavage/methylation domain-containing protein
MPIEGGFPVKRSQTLRKAHRNQEGFTLVELLIVLAILAVLIAIVLPNFTGLIGGSETTAADAELVRIQSAVDVKMADQGLATITAITTATNDMTATGFDLYPDYMRSQQSNGTYTLAADGTVTQVSTGF